MKAIRRSRRGRSRRLVLLKQFFWFLGLILLLPSIRLARTASRPIVPSIIEAVGQQGCPYQTPAEWRAFLERYADNEGWVKTCEDAPCDADYYRYVEQNVQHIFRQCAAFIENHPQIERCTRNMRRFTPVWMRQHDEDSYGFNVNNHIYLSRQQSADKPPGMMDPPPAIVAALPDRARVERAARQSGLKYLTHDSALGGYRTFVLYSDPRGRFDQWLLLNLQKGQDEVTDNTPMSILTVQKADADGRRLARVRLHFRDYTITRKDGAFELMLHENSNGKCYSCHANGVRQLIPRRTPILEALPVRGETDYAGRPLSTTPVDLAYQRLMEFNKRLRSYGSPDWDGMIIPEDHGPALGQELGCTGCHNGRTRGILTVSTSPAQLEQKTVKELSMPPQRGLIDLLERADMSQATISLDERTALKEEVEAHRRLDDAFEKARLPTLRQWFLETACG